MWKVVVIDWMPLGLMYLESAAGSDLRGGFGSRLTVDYPCHLL